MSKYTRYRGCLVSADLPLPKKACRFGRTKSGVVRCFGDPCTDEGVYGWGATEADAYEKYCEAWLEASSEGWQIR